MADILSIQITGLQKIVAKMEKYGPYATNQGLKAVNEFLNSDEVKDSMYPPRSSTFVWSSDKQRRAFFASDGFGRGIPTVRTYNLKSQGEFKVDEKYYYIEYTNSTDYWKFVIHPSIQIIGHKTNKWPTVNNFAVKYRTKIVSTFKPAALAAWEQIDDFMYGGGAGL